MKFSPSELTTELDTGTSSIRAARLGDMTATINTIEPNLDFSPALATQPAGRCQVPHWSYVVAGSMTIRYLDAADDVVAAGDLVYMEPGHTAISGPDGATVVDFSPTTPMSRFFDQVRQALGM